MVPVGYLIAKNIYGCERGLVIYLWTSFQIARHKVHLPLRLGIHKHITNYVGRLVTLETCCGLWVLDVVSGRAEREGEKNGLGNIYL